MDRNLVTACPSSVPANWTQNCILNGSHTINPKFCILEILNPFCDLLMLPGAPVIRKKKKRKPNPR